MVAALSRRNIEPSDLRLIKDIVEVSGLGLLMDSVAFNPEHFPKFSPTRTDCRRGL